MSKKTILIVDDSLTVRQQVAVTLKSAGYQTVEACDGKEGVEAVHAHAEIAMVLCDLSMPCMNGLEFVETIKGDAAVPARASSGSRAPDRGRARLNWT